MKLEDSNEKLFKSRNLEIQKYCRLMHSKSENSSEIFISTIINESSQNTKLKLIFYLLFIRNSIFKLMTTSAQAIANSVECAPMLQTKWTIKRSQLYLREQVPSR